MLILLTLVIYNCCLTYKNRLKNDKGEINEQKDNVGNQ